MKENIDSFATCTDILDESFVRIKNVIYVCSLMTSMGDNLHTVSIVNDWIFDANFTNAISFGITGLDNCCKHNSERVKYKTCKQIWLYTPSDKIKPKKWNDLNFMYLKLCYKSMSCCVLKNVCKNILCGKVWKRWLRYDMYVKNI